MNANAKLLYSKNGPAINDVRKNALTPAVLNNKLEALRILATSILTELSTLKGERKVAVRKNVDLVGEVQRFEEDLIRSALTRTGGRQRKAAALLGIKPTTLHAKMKRYGMTDDVDEEGDDIYETS